MKLTSKLALLTCVLALTVPSLASWEFSTDGDLEGWSGVRIGNLAVKDGLMTVSVSANTKDPYVRSAMDPFDGNERPGVYARMRWSTDVTGTTGTRFYFQSITGDWKGFNYPFHVPNAGFKTVFIDTLDPAFPVLWAGFVQRIRFDMTDLVPVDYTVDFDWVRLSGEFVDNESFERWDDVNATVVGWTAGENFNFEVSDPNLVNTGAWAAAVAGTDQSQSLTQNIKGGLDLPKGQGMLVEASLLVPADANGTEIVVHIAEQGKDGQWTPGSAVPVDTLDTYFVASAETSLQLDPADRTGLRVEVSITNPTDTLVYVDDIFVVTLPALPEPRVVDANEGWPINCVMLAEGQEITIDGVVSPEEYAGAQAIVINKDTARALDPYTPGFVHNMFSPNGNIFESDLEDFNATYYVMWDVNNFYIACSVQDDSYNYVGPKPNNSDALQFTLAETPFEQEKGMLYIPTIAPADSSGQVHANNVFSATFIQYDIFQNPEVEYAGSVDEATQDWTVELKIPWPVLVGDFRNNIFDPHPALGLQVGFSIVAIDFDPLGGTPVLNILATTHSGDFPWSVSQPKSSETLTFVDANGEVPSSN